MLLSESRLLKDREFSFLLKTGNLPHTQMLLALGLLDRSQLSITTSLQSCKDHLHLLQLAFQLCLSQVHTCEARVITAGDLTCLELGAIECNQVTTASLPLEFDSLSEVCADDLTLRVEVHRLADGVRAYG